MAEELQRPAAIVDKWLRRSGRIQNAHYDAAATLMRLHRWTGGLLVVLSVIEGSTLWVDIEQLTLSPYTRVAATVLGVAVAILAAMQSFMSFEARSRLHYIAGAKYGAIKRQLEARLCADPSGGKIIAELDSLGQTWDALTEESEPIPLNIWDKAQNTKRKNAKP